MTRSLIEEETVMADVALWFQEMDGPRPLRNRVHVGSRWWQPHSIVAFC